MTLQALEDRLAILVEHHAGMVADSGEYASAWSWDQDLAAAEALRKALEFGCARAILALPENQQSVKRAAALKRYIAAAKAASAVVEELRESYADIEDSV